MHYNHSLGPQQWILLNPWFDRHLKGKAGDVPKTVMPILELNQTSAQFTIKPDRIMDVARLDVYYKTTIQTPVKPTRMERRNVIDDHPDLVASLSAQLKEWLNAPRTDRE